MPRRNGCDRPYHPRFISILLHIKISVIFYPTTSYAFLIHQASPLVSLVIFIQPVMILSSLLFCLSALFLVLSDPSDPALLEKKKGANNGISTGLEEGRKWCSLCECYVYEASNR
jgi:hypothetical protein